LFLTPWIVEQSQRRKQNDLGRSYHTIPRQGAEAFDGRRLQRPNLSRDEKK